MERLLSWHFQQFNNSITILDMTHITIILNFGISVDLIWYRNNDPQFKSCLRNLSHISIKYFTCSPQGNLILHQRKIVKYQLNDEHFLST